MIAVFSDNDKELVEIVAKYLEETITLASDYKPTVIEKDPNEKYGLSGHWQIALPDICKKWPTTIEQVRNCVSDFEAGFKAAKKLFGR